MENLDMDEDEYHAFIHADQERVANLTVELSQKVRTLHNFRYLFYSLKYKSGLRNILWDKIRRPKIEAKYHPDNLQKLLENMSEQDDVSEIWTAPDN
jgi:transcriptional/translational regulatory protein YebC/TACO1